VPTQSRHHAICAYYAGHSLCSVCTTHLVFPLCAHARSILYTLCAHTLYARTDKVHTKCTPSAHTQYTQSTHEVHTKYTQVHTKYTQSIHKVNTKYAQSILWSLCLRRARGIYSISEGRDLYGLHFGFSQFMRPEAYSWIFVRVQLG